MTGHGDQEETKSGMDVDQGAGGDAGQGADKSNHIPNMGTKNLNKTIDPEQEHQHPKSVADAHAEYK